MLLAVADDRDPSGEKVSFSFRENRSGATLDVIDKELDGNQEARAIYMAGDTPGIDVVQVSFESGAKATVSITVGYDVSRIELEQYGWDILATAYDSQNFPVPDAQLDFSITAGTVSSSATTNQNGVARVSFSLPEGVNTARVTASSGTVNSTLDVVRTYTRSARISGARSLSTSQITSSIYVEQQGNVIRAELTDPAGMPVTDALLNFSIKQGVLDHEMMFTDEEGRAEQMFLLDKDISKSEVTVHGSGMSATIIVQ